MMNKIISLAGTVALLSLCSQVAHSLPETEQLLKYASDAKYDKNEFCRKHTISKGIRSNKGELCDMNVAIASYVLLACGGFKDINENVVKKNIKDFTGSKAKPQGSECYQNAKNLLSKVGKFNATSIRQNALDIVTSSNNKPSLCQLVEQCSDGCPTGCPHKIR
jgi:hypothetical protein